MRELRALERKLTPRLLQTHHVLVLSAIRLAHGRLRLTLRATLVDVALGKGVAVLAAAGQ